MRCTLHPLYKFCERLCPGLLIAWPMALAAMKHPPQGFQKLGIALWASDFPIEHFSALANQRYVPRLSQLARPSLSNLLSKWILLIKLNLARSTTRGMNLHKPITAVDWQRGQLPPWNTASHCVQSEAVRRSKKSLILLPICLLLLQSHSPKSVKHSNSGDPSLRNGRSAKRAQSHVVRKNSCGTVCKRMRD